MSKQTKTHRGAVRLAVLGMMAAISVVLVFLHFPIFPAAPWLELDFADTPIIICSVLFGSLPALSVLFVASAIQAFMLGGSGLWGFIMHFVASGAMVLAVGLISRRSAKPRKLIPALVVGILAMTAIMIPMNYLITPLNSGMGYTETAMELISSMMLPIIIPFNLIKATCNCVIAGLLIKALEPVMRRLGLVSSEKVTV